MLILIILLPLIGSLFFLHIEENVNSQSNYQYLTNNNSNINYNDILLNEEKKNSIIKQIGLSTSLITLILTIYLFSQMNSNTGLYQFGYSAGLPLAVDGISIYYVLLTAFITPICLLSN
jgi:NADH-ubiquinone oxidoreductase chain 4